MASWTCPNCARAVPGHVETCRCGAARQLDAPPAAVAPSAPKASGRGRLAGVTMAIVGGVLGSLLVRTVWSSGFGSANVTLEELTQTATRLNKLLPMMVDRNTELVNTVGMPGTFVYQYRIVAISTDGVDAAKLAKVEEIQRNQVLNLACTTPETRDKLLNRGVTMRYQYADADGRQIMRFDIKSSDCPAKR